MKKPRCVAGAFLLEKSLIRPKVWVVQRVVNNWAYVAPADIKNPKAKIAICLFMGEYLLGDLERGLEKAGSEP